jgi:hypothetical protein
MPLSESMINKDCTQYLCDKKQFLGIIYYSKSSVQMYNKCMIENTTDNPPNKEEKTPRYSSELDKFLNDPPNKEIRHNNCSTGRSTGNHQSRFSNK